MRLLLADGHFVTETYSDGHRHGHKEPEEDFVRVKAHVRKKAKKKR
jgi:hypothetical protein